MIELDVYLQISHGPPYRRTADFASLGTVLNGQQELLTRATLCITQAGLDTTLECLMHGVPKVRPEYRSCPLSNLAFECDRSLLRVTYPMADRYPI